MTTATYLPSTQTGLQYGSAHTEAARSPSHEPFRDLPDEELSDMVWIAELGMPRAIRLYELEGSIMDVFNDEGGIGCRLKWKHSEREIVLYDSPCTHYLKPLGRYPIVGGEVQLPIIHALQRAGQSSASPFGILSGSRLQQLKENDLHTENSFHMENVINDINDMALG